MNAVQDIQSQSKFMKAVQVCATPFRYVGRKRLEWIQRKEKNAEIDMLWARYHPDNITKDDLLSMFASREEA